MARHAVTQDDVATKCGRHSGHHRRGGAARARHSHRSADFHECDERRFRSGLHTRSCRRTRGELRGPPVPAYRLGLIALAAEPAIGGGVHP